MLDIDLMEQKMRQLATYDSLTSLLRRRSFMEKAAKLHHSFQKDKKPYTMILIDMDDFKYINDTFGHSQGDTVLIEFGKLANTIFDKDAYLTRLGGEEFAIISHFDLMTAYILADKLRNDFSKLNLTSYGKPVLATISIGLCESNDTNSLTLSQALHNADEALYDAKDQGKNKVNIYKTTVL
jgi:diguanylate cyclase (GGDEF)-like protein